MIEKMTGPHGKTASALAQEVGISQPTLSRWLRDASTLPPTMAPPTKDEPPMPPKRPEDWTPEEKLAVVLEAAAVSEAELGAFLRRKGLHEATLIEWRKQATEGAVASLRGEPARPGTKGDAKRIRELERELQRKEK